jgi:hypothetical protein
MDRSSLDNPSRPNAPPPLATLNGGGYDMVGSPVFLMQRPMRFQPFIRSQKRLARNSLRDHDMQWNFWTLSPGVDATTEGSQHA